MIYKLKSADIEEDATVNIPEKSILLDNRYIQETLHRITWLEPVKGIKNK